MPPFFMRHPKDAHHQTILPCGYTYIERIDCAYTSNNFCGWASIPQKIHHLPYFYVRCVIFIYLCAIQNTQLDAIVASPLSAGPYGTIV